VHALVERIVDVPVVVVVVPPGSAAGLLLSSETASAIPIPAAIAPNTNNGKLLS